MLMYINVAAKKIKITNNNLTTEEIENKLDNGDISMFSTAIIQVGHWLMFLCDLLICFMIRRPLQLRSS